MNRLSATRGVYVLALAIGAAFAVWLLSWQSILPPDPLHLVLGGDPALSALGQRYFLAEPWGWPLLHTSGLNAPDGVNIGMTDSIPLAMLVLKLFRAYLPPGFFLGAGWVALVWTLQPAAAVFALRSAGERRFVPALAVIALSLSMPALLYRYGHMALCSHAAILTAIGLYFRQVAAPIRLRPRLCAGLLAVASLLVHPYILAMVMGVLLAAPVTLLLRRDPQWRRSALSYLIVLAVVGVMAELLGYGGVLPEPGFGELSMNLLGPFLPSHSWLFPDLSLDATGLQFFEGYQYLGAGLLLLLAVMLVQLVRRRSGVAWGRHAGLLLALAGMAVFALSNNVYLGDHRLTHFGHIPTFVQQFRATGRFFWPFAYAIMLSGVVVVSRSLPRQALALLAVVVVVQVADTTALRARLWSIAHVPVDWGIDTATLGPIFAAHKRLTVWPTYGCGEVVADDVMTQVLLLASETTMPVNTASPARLLKALPCNETATVAKPLGAGELRVLMWPGSRWLVPDADRVCRKAKLFVLCASDASQWTALSTVPDTVVPMGTTFGPMTQNVTDTLVLDWSRPDPMGVWSDGPEPTLHFTVPAEASGGAVLTLEANGFAATPGGTQAIDVTANGKPVAHWDLPDAGPATVHASIPAGPVTLVMHVASPTRPIDRGLNTDTRRIGILLRSLRLDPPGQ